MRKNRHIVKAVLGGSIAEELEIAPGDEILSVNGQEIEDVFDFHYLMNDEYVELSVRKPDGEEWILEIEKDLEEELGVEFANSLMDEYRSCRNHCIFCFIDQMPRGMRETLYFKDDDSRLSFLRGNYVTLTNMSEHDIDRIIRYHLAPINISFQTTNPALRCKMLNNRFAGEALKKVQRLYEAGIKMQGQIVLCKGINDGEELERSLCDLSGYLPHLQNVSVVPVGLSKYREGLYPLEAFTQEDAKKVLTQIHRWQEKLYEEYRTHFVHAGDEWYVLADEPIPEADNYDGYEQLENGVGMLRLLEEEVKESLTDMKGDLRRDTLSVVTGMLSAPFIGGHIRRIQEKFPNIEVKVYAIRNDFFGERITVSGLLTGQDLKKQLAGQELGNRLLLPVNMLRDGENVFLDDVTVEELEEVLKVRILIVNQKGSDLVNAVIDDKTVTTHRRRQIYEQADCSNCRTS